tara:strand:+ start:1475 stop:2776 length:1302 start_codon:yes stop_codon:yes gene_type:complete
MLKKIIVIFSVLLLFSCNNNQELDLESNNSIFPVLTYDAEISETLALDTADIALTKPVELFYWSKNFQNIKNNLGNIKTFSLFKKKKKIISSSGKLNNLIQPIYFDDKLCSVNSNGFLICINTKNNETILEIDTNLSGIKKPEIIRGGIAYFDGKLVFVDAYGQIILFDSNSGETIWHKQIKFSILSPPVIYRGYVYFVSSDNRVFAINILDGEISWSFQTTSENKKNIQTSSPAAFEKLIIVPFSNGELIALRFDDGKPLWSENISKVSALSNFDIKDISANPVINGINVYTISTNGNLVSTNIINGKTNWSRNVSSSRTPIISGNVIYIIDDNSKIICLSIDTGEVYWITQLDKFRNGRTVSKSNLWLSPMLINNLIYMISYFGEINVISPKTGEILDKKNIGIKGIIAQPIVLKNSIFIADENSNVFDIR